MTCAPCLDGRHVRCHTADCSCNVCGRRVATSAPSVPLDDLATSAPYQQCSVDGCTRHHHARRLCKLHYESQRRTGSTEDLRFTTRRPVICTCPTAEPDHLGQCARCLRLVAAYSWHAGRPTVATSPSGTCGVPATPLAGGEVGAAGVPSLPDASPAPAAPRPLERRL